MILFRRAGSVLKWALASFGLLLLVLVVVRIIQQAAHDATFTPWKEDRVNALAKRYGCPAVGFPGNLVRLPALQLLTCLETKQKEGPEDDWVLITRVTSTSNLPYLHLIRRYADRPPCEKQRARELKEAVKSQETIGKHYLPTVSECRRAQIWRPK